jgi:hypothetical protein
MTTNVFQITWRSYLPFIADMGIRLAIGVSVGTYMVIVVAEAWPMRLLGLALFALVLIVDLMPAFFLCRSYAQANRGMILRCSEGWIEVASNASEPFMRIAGSDAQATTFLPPHRFTGRGTNMFAWGEYYYAVVESQGGASLLITNLLVPRLESCLSQAGIHVTREQVSIARLPRTHQS